MKTVIKPLIGRITGLDPGNEYKPLLQKTDATFVDIIHTNPGKLGTPYNSGTVDFYVNYQGFNQGLLDSILMLLFVQPGCPFLAGIIPIDVSACNNNFF